MPVIYSFSAKGNKDDYFWGTSTDETFDMDDVLTRYQTGSGTSKKMAKKYLTKLAWLADYLDWSIKKIAAKKFNDISDSKICAHQRNLPAIKKGSKNASL